MMNNFIGQRFNSLVVIKDSGERTNRRSIIWLCRCDCGKTMKREARFLKNGYTKSCYTCFLSRQRKPKSHGYTKRPEYRAWQSMMQRCYNEKQKSYRDYGARGISVSKHWHDFEKFILDMGDKPSPRHSIERIDNNKGYSKTNCKWALPSEQANNTRRNKHLTIGTETKTISQWAVHLGVPRHKVDYLVKKINKQIQKVVEI